MFGTYFYHGIMKKNTIAFGNLFNNIFIKKFDENKAVQQMIKVPLIYAPKDKVIASLRATVTGVGGVSKSVNIQLPKISFYFDAPMKNTERQKQSIQKSYTIDKNDDERIYYNYEQVPYDIPVNMSIFTRSDEDMYQIQEQIFPFFNPQLNMVINYIPQLGVAVDVPITLDAVSTIQEFEFGEEDFRTKLNTSTFNFIMQTAFIGPISTQRVIKKIYMNFYSDIDLTISQNIDEVVLTNAVSQFFVTTNPANATANSVWTYDESWKHNFEVM